MKDIAFAGVVYVLASAGIWFFATQPGRDTAAAFEKYEAKPDDTRQLQKELMAVYRDHPHQAWEDYRRRPVARGVIALACATLPDSRNLVEYALTDHDLTPTFYIALHVATGGNPTLVEGTWTGQDKLSLPPAWIPWFRDAVDRETRPELIVFYGQILRSTGWTPDPDKALARANDLSLPFPVRVAALALLAEDAPGRQLLFQALDKASIPDDIASGLLNSGVLAEDPAYRPFIEAWALKKDHAVAAGGAFTTIFEHVDPKLGDPLWENVRAVPAGKRIPLMLSLCGRGKWTTVQHRWWAQAWEEEKKRDEEGARRAIQPAALGILPVWIKEEQEESVKKKLEAIFDYLLERR